MAEIASHPDLQHLPGTERRTPRRAEATSVAAPLRSAASQARLSAHGRQEKATTETAVDRYAFYFFMGTITLGILAMVVMAFTI